MNFKRWAAFIVVIVYSFSLKLTYSQPYEEIFKFKKSQKVAPATFYEKYSLLTSEGFVDIHILKINLKDDGVYFNTLSSYPAHSGQYVYNMVYDNANKNPIAAINANFFYTNNQTTYNKLWPIGLSIKDGKILSSPNNKANTFPSFIYDIFGKASIEQINTNQIDVENLSNGYKFKIAHINKFTGDLTYPILFTGEYVNHTLGNKYQDIVEMLISNNVVIDIRTNSLSIPIEKDVLYVAATKGYGKYILDNFKIGDNVRLNINLNFPYENIFSASSGNTFLLKNGELQKFTHEITGRHPRSAIGYDKNRNWLYMVSIDGRNHTSIGATQEELALFLKSIGVYDAINLDGGYSSQLIGLNVDGTYKLYNQNENPRKVFDSLAAFYKFKEDKLSTLNIVTPSGMFVGEEYPIDIFGQDRYGNVLPIDKTNLTVYFESYPIDISNGKITPLFSGAIAVNAVYSSVYENVYGTIKVSCYQPEYLKVYPSDLYLNVNESQKLSFSIFDRFGHYKEIEAGKVKMISTDKSISYSDGTITAKKEGLYTIEFEYNGLISKLALGVGENSILLRSFDYLTFVRPPSVKYYLSTINKTEGKYSNKIFFTNINKSLILNFKEAIDVQNYDKLTFSIAASNCKVYLVGQAYDGTEKFIEIENTKATFVDTTVNNVFKKVTAFKIKPIKKDGYIWLDNLKGISKNLPATNNIGIQYLHSTEKNSKDSIFIIPYTYSFIDNGKKSILMQHASYYKKVFSLVSSPYELIRDGATSYENIEIIRVKTKDNSIYQYDINQYKLIKQAILNKKIIGCIIDISFEELNQKDKDILTNLFRYYTQRAFIIAKSNYLAKMEKVNGVLVFSLPQYYNPKENRILGIAINQINALPYFAD